ncbi:hypothetical protein BDQ12DRAFT_461749 [Crucibulum laeve]|uniref:Uncharacterized protein n=1 Tax=Crucibulum laeve TaxID=68775 RepID=A0A5C3M878_9AGAR|nr:hypothetical protein BDQ12DRAFT_461749 [Crucibulum laeve]
MKNTKIKSSLFLPMYSLTINGINIAKIIMGPQHELRISLMAVGPFLVKTVYDEYYICWQKLVWALLMNTIAHSYFFMWYGYISV